MKRVMLGLLSGALLGVVCIIGASIRQDDPGTLFLFAFWFNRVVMGLAIGMLPVSSKQSLVLKGAILGTFISFAFYITTEFQDLIGFLAGIVYGVIIALVIQVYNDRYSSDS